jgi:hypothetical protein
MEVMVEMRVCKKHGETAHSKDVNGRFRCRKCSVERVTEWRRRLKKRAVDYLGGKCVICGYDKYVGSMVFHHREENKSFGVSGHGNTRSWKRVVEELKKCDLLCLNCHSELHFME